MFESLLAPLRVGPVALPNRIVSTAHQTTLVRDGIPTDDFVAYHAARAAGGVGLIVLEALAVHATGTLSAHSITGYDPEVVPALARVAAAAHGEGGRVFAQLFHGGREHFEGAPRGPVAAPSPVPSARFRTEPRALEDAEIRDIIAAHGLVTGHCRDAGLDGVELCASHGYLPAQFLNPRTNRRDDAWGGTWERRLAYTRAALRAMRRSAGPELAVGIRLSATELGPEGRGVDESAAVLAALERDGLIDYASIVIGDSAEHDGSAYIVPPPPVERAVIGAAARAVRPHVGVPLIAASRVQDPEDAEALLAEGACDAVGMNRALIADPELPRKLREGRAEERILCIGCNVCIARYHADLPIRCLQNARTGREAVAAPPAARAPTGRRVVVVGAGPAGLAAAEAAALAGASVLVLEQSGETGGQLALAGRAPAHAELAERFVHDRGRRLARAGAALELGVRVQADDDRLRDADAVILATGARPHRPAGTPASFLDAWDALRDPSQVAGPAVVADWGGGWEGLDAAEVLALAGLPTTLAVGAPAVGETIHQYARALALGRLETLGVTIVHHRALDLRGPVPGLRSIWTHRPEPLPAGTRTVVIAQGREPVDELGMALGAAGVPVVSVGDCRGPRSAEEAVLEGAAAGERAAAATGHASATPPRAARGARRRATAR